MIPPKARTTLIALVSAAWAISIVVTMFSDSYNPDPSINALFSGVIGAALAVGRGGDKSE